MFGKKKQPPIRTLIGEGTVIRGELRFTEGLRIDGEVLGDVVAAGDERSILVISEKARVTGKVTRGHVIINGAVAGPVHSTRTAGTAAEGADRRRCPLRGARNAPGRHRSTANCGRLKARRKARTEAGGSQSDDTLAASRRQECSR